MMRHNKVMRQNAVPTTTTAKDVNIRDRRLGTRMISCIPFTRQTELHTQPPVHRYHAAEDEVNGLSFRWIDNKVHTE